MLAKMYILSDAVDPMNRDSCDSFAFRSKYIRKEEGLALDCHFDLLILLYEKEMGLPPRMRNDPAFNSFCQGWYKLDKEFGFSNSPHARKELRY